MKQKRVKIVNEKNGESKILISIITLALFFGIIIVSALTTEEALQSEFNSLENELINNGYSWLVNYLEINESSISASGSKAGAV